MIKSIGRAIAVGRAVVDAFIFIIDGNNGSVTYCCTYIK